MVLIEIDDEVWSNYTRSWALLGVRTKEKAIEMLESQLNEESINILENAEHELIDNTPEALIQRQIGILKEEKEKRPQ